jgi:hypothetical protein
MPEVDWNEVVERKPQGYVEFNDGRTATHGPLESIEIDEADFVVIRLKWRAQVELGAAGMPIGDWTAVANEEPIMFPNFTVAYEIEGTPEKGPRVRFGLNIIYFNRVEGLDPSRVVGLELNVV